MSGGSARVRAPAPPAGPARLRAATLRARARARRAVLRVLREFWETLILIGRLCAGDTAQPPPAPRPLTGPPPGHPERVAGSTPPDARERALWDDILGREP